MNNQSLEDVAEYTSRFGRRGVGEFQILAEMIKYFEQVVINSPGREILEEDSKRCISLMRKSYTNDLTPDEQSELKYLKLRLDKISNKLFEFQEMQKKVVGKIEDAKSKR